MPNISFLSSDKAGCSGFKMVVLPYIFVIMKTKQDNIEILLGRRIRSLRNLKGWTQQELGNRSDVNYKFLGEIERGQQNPSFNILVKVANALEVDLQELFRFEQEIANRKEIEDRIKDIIKNLPDDALRNTLLMLRVLYPTK